MCGLCRCPYFQVSMLTLTAGDYDISSSGYASDQFMFTKIDCSTVFTHLSSLDVRKSTGPGDLSSWFLK